MKTCPVGALRPGHKHDRPLRCVGYSLLTAAILIGALCELVPFLRHAIEPAFAVFGGTGLTGATAAIVDIIADAI